VCSSDLTNHFCFDRFI